MTRRLSVVAMVCVLSAVNLAAQRAESAGRIEGVWKCVEQTINGRTLSGANLGVGYHIYTKGYFAAVRESDVPPRPPFPGDRGTAAQILAAYGPFVAQFGSYTVSADRLSTRILVAKNPENMDPSTNAAPTDQRFRIDGDTLTLEDYDKTTPGRKIALKLVRVE